MTDAVDKRHTCPKANEDKLTTSVLCYLSRSFMFNVNRIPASSTESKLIQRMCFGTLYVKYVQLN